MAKSYDILCIGSVLWDVIGRTDKSMNYGNDVPGRITRLPGGVAMNIAMGLARFGLRPVLLTSVGMDAEGDELLGECTERGMVTDYVHRDAVLPTDRYMAIECEAGLVAAIADAHSLEAAGGHILAAMEDGRLGSEAAPYSGPVALDGNLTEALLAEIATRPSFAAADLRVAPASPGKATRLRPLIGHKGATFYVNLEEAGLILGTVFTSARSAAEGFLDEGVARALVTDGAQEAALAQEGTLFTALPPKVTQARVTGAGDTFMAAHIAAETRGQTGLEALEAALAAAAKYVSGEDPV
jgi:pseudouridine kinase